MTDPIDEAAVLAEMTAKLEAEGLAASTDSQSHRLRFLPPDEKVTLPPTPDCTYPGWTAQQQPASLAYLRELVQMARESGMTYIRTGNLEMKFDTDARKPAATGDNRTTF